MDEQNKDTEEQIKFTQLLKELADTQVTLAKINAQLAIRESKDQIETIVDSKSKELIEQAKKFGAKLEKIEQEYANQNADREGIVEEFEKRLAEASEEYDKILQDIMEKKAQFELDENGILLEQKRNKVKMAAENKEFAKTKQRLEKEIVQALKSGDMSTLQQKTEELKSHIENNPTDISRTHAQELQARREEIKQAIESCKNEYEQIMAERKKMLEEMRENDLLILTADHGNDPTWTGTDHTREQVPLLVYSPSLKEGGKLPETDTFGVIGATVADNFEVKMPEGTIGTSILGQFK